MTTLSLYDTPVYDDYIMNWKWIFGYETEAPVHVLLEGCQQQCSYDIDHMDEPMYQLKFTALVQCVKCKANYHYKAPDPYAANRKSIKI